MLPSSPFTWVISPFALSVTTASFPAISSKLTVSCEAMIWPGATRGASLAPVLTKSAGSLTTLTEPSFAMLFSFTGVPFLRATRISMRVGSDCHGRTLVIVPALMPPNRTGAPASRPPAYFRYVRYDTLPPLNCAFAR